MPALLGPISLFWGLPSGGFSADPGQLRLYPWVAGILSRRILRTSSGAPRLFRSSGVRFQFGGPAMIDPNSIKLVPRNVAALRKGQDPSRAAQPVSGNPVSTRLESGVGNCFPGLECDLRNLERRFFPFLEANITDNEIAIVSVDTAGVDLAVSANTMTAALAKLYHALAQDISQNRRSTVTSIKGN